MDSEGIHLHLIGHNEKGFVGFLNGSYELVYLEKPENWEDLVNKSGLPYISREDVRAVQKQMKKEAKDGKKVSVNISRKHTTKK